FPAGEVVATLTKTGEGAKDAYEVKATGASRGFVSLLYTVHDEFSSVFDPRTVCSESISKKISEGRRRKDTRIVFDGARKLAILDERDLAAQGAPAKHAENAIPGCVQDVVSAFYFIRRQPLRVGEQIHRPFPRDTLRTTPEPKGSAPRAPAGSLLIPAACRLYPWARRRSTSGPQVRKGGLTRGDTSPPAAAGIATDRAGRRFALCQEKG